MGMFERIVVSVVLYGREAWLRGSGKACGCVENELLENSYWNDVV